jgi:putative transport protein
MIELLIETLIESPVLLLFTVAAIGYAVGEVKIGSFNLGISGVLFTGLVIGSLSPELKLPESMYVLGLVLFVYTVGISNGPGFYSSIKKRGVKDNVLALSIISFGLFLTFIFSKIFGFRASLSGGLFTGSMTNTPAMASLIDYIKINFHNADEVKRVIAEPVIAYSVAYPFGVVGAMLAIYLFQYLFKINYKEEEKTISLPGISTEKIITKTLAIRKTESVNLTKLLIKENLNVIPGRMKSHNHTGLISEDTILSRNDLVTLTGVKEDLDKIIEMLGEEVDEHLEFSRKNLDFRRIFVSNYKIAGFRIEELKLNEKFGALVTRIRRGDTDLIAHHDSIIELGDRVRVVAPREKMDEISKFFGDSYKSLSEVNLLTFGLGIALGLVLGLIPFPLPGGTSFKLGFAGGPLIVGLILGILGRSGPFIWSLPYNANLTLRQIGLTLFLAGVGTKAGYSFFSTAFSTLGLKLFVAGGMITFLVASLTLFIGYKIMKIPMSLLIGMLSGIQTQPALLGFSCERTKNEIPNVGYAMVYPISTISKIILVQILYILLD